MDKSQLLKELAKLKRILNDHENEKSKVISNTTLYENKSVEKAQSNPVNNINIFVNPRKLNTVHDKSTINGTDDVLHNDTSRLVSKVFINPNFKKPENLSTSQVQSKLLPFSKEKQKKLHSCRNEIHVGFPQDKIADLKKPSTDDTCLLQQRIFTSNNRLFKLSLDDTKYCNSDQHVIYVNPDFSSSHLDVGSRHSQREFTSLKSKPHYQNLSSESGTTQEEKVILNMGHKRSICCQGKAAESTKLYKRRKESKNNVKALKNIFFNPNFQERGADNKTNGFDPKKCGNDVSFKNCSPCDTANSVARGNLTPDVSVKKDEVSTRFTILSHPVCSGIEPKSVKEIDNKSFSQRYRTSSTSLVSISSTKMERRRKSSLKSLDPCGKFLNQPLFVSKTKLVRNVSKKALDSSYAAKLKVKQHSSKTQIQCPLAENVRKLKKRNSTDSVSKQAGVVPNSTTITKVKSKNGKSLKLIRKTMQISTTLVPNSTTITKVKSKNGKSLKLIRKNMQISTNLLASKNMRSLNSTNNRKMNLRQQANRFTMSLVQSKLNRNQFSKINSPFYSQPRLQSYNKYVCGERNVSTRKTLTKAALVGMKETPGITARTTQVRNTSLDKTKFIKTKYRLIRNQTGNIHTRYKFGKKMNKATTSHKLVSYKKLKWKTKSNKSKGRLTRKDLSIKKIGGVFYRYSRTTLMKNKTVHKKVPQHQSNGTFSHLYEQTLSVGRRQNISSVYKKCERKSINIGGVALESSPSGMTWRRKSYNIARSILTQAKHKSIHLLSKKLKKNNEPCLFFHRHGECSGLKRGTCVRLHDKKYVAVCKKFLQSTCTDSQCKLSHEPSCHNLATCHHFLAGNCGRDNCPYPHVKVSDIAPICLDFLKGYCLLGDQCAKRHLEICPSFEKGICARGKYCPYPHPKSKPHENLKGKFKRIKSESPPVKKAETVSTPNLRYFEDVNLQKENEIQLNEEQEKLEAGDSDAEGSGLKKRPKLGVLPSFIPLNFGVEVEKT